MKRDNHLEWYYGCWMVVGHRRKGQHKTPTAKIFSSHNKNGEINSKEGRNYIYSYHKGEE
jgi:hypothetical protein